MAIRFLHIILAVSTLFSSAGLVFNKHYCRSELKSVALFIKAESCHRSMQEQHRLPACPMHQSKACHQEKKGCCDDQAEYLKNTQDQQFQPQEQPGLKKITHWVPSLFAYQAGVYAAVIRPVPYLNYKPPLLACDRPVAFQAFLL